MSIVKKSGGGGDTPTGSVHLFSSANVPEGFERLASMAVPAAAYAKSQRITLLENPYSSLNNYHLFSDPSSDEHVYVAYSSTLRRLHLPSGLTEAMPSPPRDLGTTGLYVSGISVATGAVFFSVGSASGSTQTSGYRYDANLAAWTQIATNPGGMGSALAYDEANAAVYILGGTLYRSTGSVHSTAVYRYDLATNVLTTLDVSLPVTITTGGSAVVLGDQILYTGGGGLRRISLATGSTAVVALPTGTLTTNLALHRLSDEAALLSTGAALLRVALVDGVWTVGPADIAGSAGWTCGLRALARPHRPLSGASLLHYVPTTTADSTLLGLLMLEGLDTPPNASLFYARKV